MISQENQTNFNEEQINQFQEAFSLFDKSGVGSIPTKELGAIMRALGSNPTEFQLVEINKEYNFDEDGTVNFHQFLILAEKYITIEDQNNIESLIRKTFNCDGGIVSTAELRYIMKSLGEKGLSDEELEEMINEADPENLGSISVDDFCKLFEK